MSLATLRLAAVLLVALHAIVNDDLESCYDHASPTDIAQLSGWQCTEWASFDCSEGGWGVETPAQRSLLASACPASCGLCSSRGYPFPWLLRRLASLGPLASSSLLLLAGFAAAASGRRAGASARLREAVATSLPAFEVAALSSLLIAAASGFVPTGQYVLMFPFAADALHPQLRQANLANGPSWLYGSATFGGALAASLVGRLRSKSALAATLALSLAATFWHAAIEAGASPLALPFGSLALALLLGPGLPALAAGTVLHEVQRRRGATPAGPIRHAAALALAAASTFAAAFALDRLPPLTERWAQTGLALPLCAATLLLAPPPPAAPTLDCWLSILLAAQPAWRLARTVARDQPTGAFALFWAAAVALLEGALRPAATEPTRRLLSALVAPRLEPVSSAERRMTATALVCAVVVAFGAALAPHASSTADAGATVEAATDGSADAIADATAVWLLDDAGSGEGGDGESSLGDSPQLLWLSLSLAAPAILCALASSLLGADGRHALDAATRRAWSIALRRPAPASSCKADGESSKGSADAHATDEATAWLEEQQLTWARAPPAEDVLLAVRSRSDVHAEQWEACRKHSLLRRAGQAARLCSCFLASAMPLAGLLLRAAAVELDAASRLALGLAWGGVGAACCLDSVRRAQEDGSPPVETAVRALLWLLLLPLVSILDFVAVGLALARTSRGSPAASAEAQIAPALASAPPAVARAAAVWSDALRGAPSAPLPLHLLTSSAATGVLEGRWDSLPLSEASSEALRSHAAALGCQPLEVAAVALAWVAAVHSCEPDATVLVEGGDVGGCVPLRLLAEGEATLRDLCFAAAGQLSAGWSHAMRADEIAACGPSEWRTARHPLGLRVTRFAGCGSPGALVVLEVPPAGAVTLHFAASHISAATAARLAERIGRCCLASAEERLSGVPLMGEAEAHEVTIACNRTKSAFPLPALLPAALAGAKALEASAIETPALEPPPAESATVHAAFYSAAARHPDAVALRSVGEQAGGVAVGGAVTYAELAARVGRLAAALEATCLLSPSQRLVATILDRGVEMVVALLGTLTAGGAYLPMEPDFPAARVREIAEEATPALALVQTEEMAALFSPPDGDHPAPHPVFLVDAFGRLSPAAGLSPVTVYEPGGLAGPTEGAGPLQTGADDLVYVMYTSGTTGKPKGVMVEHGPLLMRTAWFQSTYRIGVGDVVPFKTQFIFGVSEWELWWTLATGATLAITPPPVVRSPSLFADALVSTGATIAFLIPSHVDALLAPLAKACRPAARLRGGRGGAGMRPSVRLGRRLKLRSVVCCGEALSAATVGRFHEALRGKATIDNVYGPTEGSMTHYRCPHGVASEPLIGRPISNTVVLVMDAELRPAPLGVPGEVVFGCCVARGYLRRDDLTSARFVANPLWSEAEARKQPLYPCLQSDGAVPPCPLLYRTGDLAVRSGGGDLRFLGRMDRQVKVRGHRIELEAVEAVLRDYRDEATAAPLSQLAVVASGDELLAFVRLPPGDAPPAGVLSFCEARLPRYMVPSRLIALPAFPALPNGKTDLGGLACGGADLGATVERLGGGGGGGGTSTDSLGNVRRLTAAGGALEAENGVSDVLRALFMYGVISDHMLRCADATSGGACGALAKMLWQLPGPQRAALGWLDVPLRMLGGYKDMSGFVMVTAFADARYEGATRFSKPDLIVLACYLMMLYVFDPLIYAACEAVGAGGCEGRTNVWTGDHRWYLLMMLYTKAALVLLRLCRVPPLAQCLLVTAAALMMPPRTGCLEPWRCADKPDWSPAWWSGAALAPGSPLPAASAFLFRGLLYDDLWGMWSDAIYRYYVAFAAQYFWTFYYGRPAFALLRRTALLAAPASRAGRVALFGCAFVLVELLIATSYGAALLPSLQQQVDGHGPPLLAALAILLLLALSVLLCAAACGFALAGRRPPRLLRLAGSTTLGCYISHRYLLLFYNRFVERWILSLYGPLGGGGPALALQLLLSLLLPALYQVTVGPATHWLILLPVRLLLRLGRLGRLGRRLFRRLSGRLRRPRRRSVAAPRGRGLARLLHDQVAV